MLSIRVDLLYGEAHAHATRPSLVSPAGLHTASTNATELSKASTTKLCGLTKAMISLARHTQTTESETTKKTAPRGAPTSRGRERASDGVCMRACTIPHASSRARGSGQASERTPGAGSARELES